ncbi:MAG TPA: DoxX family protein [Gemmatimonadales bacterium]
MNQYLFLAGRVLFSWMFIVSGFNHLTKMGMMAQYSASQGVPAPTLAVAVTGLMLLAGGFSILLGYKPRWGALLLVVFLVPTAVIMHRFWGVADPMMAQNQMAHFWKNIVMAGGALMIYYFATVHPERWPYSLGR